MDASHWMRRLVPVLLVMPLLGPAGCGDEDDDSTGHGIWGEVTPAVAPDECDITAAAFCGTRGILVGVVLNSRGWHPLSSSWMAVREGTGDWVIPGQPSLTDGGRGLHSVACTPSGEAIVAGWQSNGLPPGVILDERNGWSHHEVAVLGGNVAVDGGTARVAGFGASPMLVSTTPDVWTPEELPFSGTDNDRGIRDMVARNGVFVACGWDDGADGTAESPYQVLFRNDGPGWSRLEVPCGGCGNREFRAVALTATGGILLGGAITDFAAGAPDEYEAFLLVRSPAGQWTEIVIPESGRLDEVNDIYVAADGDIYLACGTVAATILRKPADGALQCELEVPVADISQLTGSPDGAIWASGLRYESERHPMLWKRVD